MKIVMMVMFEYSLSGKNMEDDVAIYNYGGYSEYFASLNSSFILAPGQNARHQLVFEWWKIH